MAERGLVPPSLSLNPPPPHTHTHTHILARTLSLTHSLSLSCSIRVLFCSLFEMAWKMGSLGAFALAKEVSPYMVKRGGGTIIYTSATAAYRGNSGQHAHTMVSLLFWDVGVNTLLYCG
jgi:NAD(P)-dependent dehydrogenase (short-subunit alcohol dehydrogenase family)